MDIVVPSEVKIGGFTYTVDSSEEACERLRESKDFGHCINTKRLIRINTEDYSGQENSNTFLHELIEAINDVWCNPKLGHDEITNLCNGLHQVLEGLDVRFVGKKS